MKVKKPFKKTIKLLHVAYNPYSENIGNYVLKLAYSFYPVHKPRIELFENTEMAQAKSWETYGAIDPYILLEHTFEKERETVKVPTKGHDAAIDITWIGFKKELYTYAKGNEEVFVYSFEICTDAV